MTLPLEGLLVVSIEQAVAAPMCTCPLAGGECSYFVWLNRGKESAVLDLTTQADKALLEALLARADVFVQNLKPGGLAKLGFAIDRLRRDHPRLIICSISGYGEAGPYAGRKAYDL